MRAVTVSRFWVNESVMVTSWPATANTCAMPWPMRPAPTTAMRAFAGSAVILARRVAAVGVEDVAGVEVGGFRGEEQERTGEIGRLAEPPLGHAGEKALTHRVGALVVLEHPLRQRRAEDCGAERVDGDAGLAPLAAERFGDAVDRRLRG